MEKLGGNFRDVFCLKSNLNVASARQMRIGELMRVDLAHITPPTTSTDLNFIIVNLPTTFILLNIDGYERIL